MIKHILLSLMLLFAFQFVKANKVDDLKTDSDVITFLTSLDKMFTQKYSQPITLKTPDEILNEANCPNIKGWTIKTWEKIDFNNDGKSDLLVNANWNNGNNGFVVIDLGNNTFKLTILRYSIFSKCEIVKSLIFRNKAFILFNFNYTQVNENAKRYQDAYITVPKTDTLIYNFNSFLEFNPKPPTLKIESIKFETGACFGSCPIFSVEINKKGEGNYFAGAYNKKGGYFRTMILPDDLSEIYAVASYIDISNLKNDYQVAWTDMPTCNLTITFKDGTIKKITDYGEQGTFGLQKLYSLFFALRENQNWQHAN